MDQWEQWRMTLLGASGVGKTTLTVQFTMNRFIRDYDPTLQDNNRKQFIVDNRVCFLELIQVDIDTPTQGMFEGQGFILVYSIASRSTFDQLEGFHQLVQRVKKAPVLILVGNKCDIVSEREVSKDEGAALARRFSCEFLETSAKTAQNVERVFSNLVRALRAKHREAQLPLKEKKKTCLIL
ncbi:P-loop containing nucleoside triphosphate hydrolase protein [Mycena amicta]|nr:P-loop containing nucleoside triphosphate hydrolase protein [Mycena amicta]